MDCEYHFSLHEFSDEIAAKMGLSVPREYFDLELEWSPFKGAATINFRTIVSLINEAFGIDCDPIIVAKKFVEEPGLVFTDTPNGRISVQSETTKLQVEPSYRREGSRVFVKFDEEAMKALLPKKSHKMSIRLWLSSPDNRGYFTAEEETSARESMSALKRLFEERALVRTKKRRVKAL